MWIASLRTGDGARRLREESTLRSALRASRDLDFSTADKTAVGSVIARSLPHFGVVLTLGDGVQVPVLRSDAVLAELLERGGLAIGIAGVLLRLLGAQRPDPDDVRDLLNAACKPERFQPLLELLEVA